MGGATPATREGATARRGGRGRGAVAAAVHAVYLGAAGAAALAFVVQLVVAPRRFPVRPE